MRITHHDDRLEQPSLACADASIARTTQSAAAMPFKREISGTQDALSVQKLRAQVTTPSLASRLQEAALRAVASRQGLARESRLCLIGHAGCCGIVNRCMLACCIAHAVEQSVLCIMTASTQPGRYSSAEGKEQGSCYRGEEKLPPGGGFSSKSNRTHASAMIMTPVIIAQPTYATGSSSNTKLEAAARNPNVTVPNNQLPGR